MEKINKISNGVKLLIITQKVDLNDDVLGFMHGWIAEFAKQCEQVTVICLAKGAFELPANAKILSLGKENGRSKIKYLINFYKYIWRERKNYDAVFIHMNQQYAILGAPFWKLFNKKIGLWYAHGHVPASLKIAEKLVDIIFTSTKSGCRLVSRKIKIVGQGIDLSKFKVESLSAGETGSNLKVGNRNKIISIGRISPSKDYGTLIKAVEILKNKGVALTVEIIGGPAVEADKKYLFELREMAKAKNLDEIINFVGPVANKDIVGYLESAGLFVNMGLTGSLDKAILEAMATGIPILSCNESFKEVLGDFKEILMYPKGDFEILARKIQFISGLAEEKYFSLGAALRKIVATGHSLPGLVMKILNLYGFIGRTKK